jgi:hypothetical protein
VTVLVRLALAGFAWFLIGLIVVPWVAGIGWFLGLSCNPLARGVEDLVQPGRR